MTLYLGPSHLARLFQQGHVTPADCVAAVEAALGEQGRGEVGLLPRQILWEDGQARAPRGRALKLSAAYMRGSQSMGASVYATHFQPGEVEMWLLVFDGQSGQMHGVLHGKALSLWKTGATAAVATRHLARADARRAALIGTGRYALTQALCLHAVRPLDELRCYSRDRARLEAFCIAARAHLPGVRVLAAPSARGAVADADVVTTITSSPMPVLEGAWLAPGVHCNLMGQHAPTTREADTATVADARVFVDARAQALAEKGELLMPLQEGRLSEADIAGELGQLVAGLMPGRLGSAQRTVFCSGGTATEYMSLCRLLVDRAERAGIGQALMR